MNTMKHLPAAITLAAALLFVFYTDWANALLSCIALAGLVVVGVVGGSGGAGRPMCRAEGARMRGVVQAAQLLGMAT